MLLKKTHTIIKYIQIAGLLSIIILTGCSGEGIGKVDETQERHYQRGKRLYQEGRYQEALSAFLKVTEKHSIAPESHLEIGRIYLEHIKDPIAAIYHFRKFLEFKPNVEQSLLVRQMIETAQKDFAQALPGPSLVYGDERLDLLQLVQQVRNENLMLKRQLAEAKKRMQKMQVVVKNAKNTSSSSNNSSKNLFAPKAEELKAGPRNQFYTVDYGDTLTRISTKIFGTTERWEEIFNANRDTLSSPHDLRVGQVLKIP